MRAWSFYTLDAPSTYAGHGGYDDVVRSRYSYDSGVANHKQVKVGDLVVLRDGTGSLGFAFVEELIATNGMKDRQRCPICNTSQIDERASINPRYRCTKGHTFDHPVLSTEPVRKYRAEYMRSFVGSKVLDADTLEELSTAPAKQNSIRELDLDGTLALLRDRGVFPAFVEAHQ
jgi:hypothetical protein